MRRSVIWKLSRAASLAARSLLLLFYLQFDSPFLSIFNVDCRSSRCIGTGSVCDAYRFEDLSSRNLVVVDTSLGQVMGVKDGPINAFLGIPFAEPPLGRYRFRPPRPKRPWYPSLYRALNFAPECLQSSLYTGEDDPLQRPRSEDCLYLNIWQPNRRRRHSSAAASGKSTPTLAPVLIWIYGGAFLHGGASRPEYVGDKLAARGVVVVSFNYRVGALGFLVSTADGLYGNYGLNDQKLAIQWVHDNIESFGGDPDRVTLFGESAGAMSIGLHLLDQQLILSDYERRRINQLKRRQQEQEYRRASSRINRRNDFYYDSHGNNYFDADPHYEDIGYSDTADSRRRARSSFGSDGQLSNYHIRRRVQGEVNERKLFHAVILQSNPLGYKYRSIAVANFIGKAYKEHLDCEDLRCMQSESAEELIHVQDTLMAVPRSIGDFFTWGPVITDQSYYREARLRPGPLSNITVRQPIEAMKELRNLDVPVIIGTTSHEGTVFVFTAYPTRMTKIIYQALVFSFFRAAAPKVLRMYAPLAKRIGDSVYPDFRLVLSRIIGDYLFRCPNQFFASQLTGVGTSVFLYEFALATRTPGFPCCDGLACHTCELPYVFNQLALIEADYTWQDGVSNFFSSAAGYFTSSGRNSTGGIAAEAASGASSGKELPSYAGVLDTTSIFDGDANASPMPDIFGAASAEEDATSAVISDRIRPLSNEEVKAINERFKTDTKVSNTIASFWTTFATYGDPNGRPTYQSNGYAPGTRSSPDAPWWPRLLGDLPSPKAVAEVKRATASQLLSNDPKEGTGRSSASGSSGHSASSADRSKVSYDERYYQDHEVRREKMKREQRQGRQHLSTALTTTEDHSDVISQMHSQDEYHEHEDYGRGDAVNEISDWDYQQRHHDNGLDDWWDEYSTGIREEQEKLVRDQSEERSVRADDYFLLDDDQVTHERRTGRDFESSMPPVKSERSSKKMDMRSVERDMRRRDRADSNLDEFDELLFDPTLAWRRHAPTIRDSKDSRDRRGDTKQRNFRFSEGIDQDFDDSFIEQRESGMLRGLRKQLNEFGNELRNAYANRDRFHQKAGFHTEQKYMHQLIFDEDCSVVIIENDCICNAWNALEYRF